MTYVYNLHVLCGHHTLALSVGVPFVRCGDCEYQGPAEEAETIIDQEMQKFIDPQVERILRS
jgi:hypothetical protein